MKLGYTLLYVEEVEETMDFYAKAFGLEKGFLHESKQYGEMKSERNETKLGFVQHETASSHGFSYLKAKLSSEAFGCEIAFVTSEVEKAYQKAVSAGAKEMSPPQVKPWGQVVAYVRDCNGFLVELCSPMG
jgi:uncharacterized glyoxalase superfamily protein PhnB